MQNATYYHMQLTAVDGDGHCSNGVVHGSETGGGQAEAPGASFPFRREPRACWSDPPSPPPSAGIICILSRIHGIHNSKSCRVNSTVSAVQQSSKFTPVCDNGTEASTSNPNIFHPAAVILQCYSPQHQNLLSTTHVTIILSVETQTKPE